MDVNLLGGSIVPHTYNSVSGQVEHDRVTGIDLSNIIGEGETTSDSIIGLLAIAITDGITTGLVEQLAAIGAIHLSDTITFHISTGKLIFARGVIVKRG
ncbi:hypothetical protein SDC9_109694 [bioreactor metagenome]|uniref:Uncharacterized protein n=1 Tax=bioreactor metagenome TaxID=1076179 RepID=A0A645BCJ6_9ZZZZ